MPIPASLLNLDGTISYINHAAETFHNMRATQQIGKKCHNISHPQHLTQEECPLCQAITSQKDVHHLALYCEVKKRTLTYTLHFMHIDKKIHIIHFCQNVASPTPTPNHSDIIPERVKLALKSFKAGMYEWNMLDDSAYVSNEWKIMLGYNPDMPFPPITLNTWKNRVHPDDIDRVMQNLQKALNSHEDYIETTHRLKHKDGYWIWILGRGLIEYDVNHSPLRMIGMHTDISEHIALQQKSTERRKILDHSLNEIYIFNAKNFKFLYINKGAKHNTGYSFTEISKLSPLDLNPNMEKKYFSDILNKVINNKDNHTFFSTQCQRKNGSLYDIEVYLQATTFENTNAYVAIVLDVTERKKKETLIQEQADGLYYLAHYDMLTGLANRVLLTEKLKQSIKKAKQHKTQLTLLFIDINKFKAINDSFGHHVGDKVLKEIAHRLKKTIREEDTIARFGGDEFIILLENTENTSDLKYKIQNALNEPLIVNTYSLNITCSIGISIYPNDANTLDKLLNDADKKMYEEKKNTIDKIIISPIIITPPT